MLYSTSGGHVLRVGDVHHDVHLDDASVGELVGTLLGAAEPTDDRARGALVAMRDAGLVDTAPGHLTVLGEGVLAGAVRSALRRMGAQVDAGGKQVAVLDDDALPSGLPDDAAACWVVGPHVIFAPDNVSAADVRARFRAAHTQADQPVPEPADAGVRSARSLLEGAGLELAAVLVAAELLRAGRPPYEALMVDLVAVTSSRHPVLPVPPAPR